MLFCLSEQQNKNRSVMCCRRLPVLSLVFTCVLPCMVIANSADNSPVSVTFTAEQDHQNMMDQLGIKQLRPGFRGNESAPNHANYRSGRCKSVFKLARCSDAQKRQKRHHAGDVVETATPRDCGGFRATGAGIAARLNIIDTGTGPFAPAGVTSTIEIFTLICE